MSQPIGIEQFANEFMEGVTLKEGSVKTEFEKWGMEDFPIEKTTARREIVLLVDFDKMTKSGSEIFESLLKTFREKGFNVTEEIPKRGPSEFTIEYSKTI